ncbi:MAG: carbon storage regulator [Pseudomonadota bacterium]|nr:carbon storage regulator [Pseudomonadota bacterium]
MSSQLLLSCGKGKEIIIGDHCVITVVSASGSQARLGFVTRDFVARVKDPATVMEAAKIKARVGRNVAPFREEMEKMLVYVATTFDMSSDHPAPQIKAALTNANATYPGAQVMAVDGSTHEGPTHHQFLVVRCATPPEATTVRTLMNELGKPFLDEIEHADASLYLLFVQTLPQTGGKDVRYIDLAPMNGDQRHE